MRFIKKKKIVLIAIKEDEFKSLSSIFFSKKEKKYIKFGGKKFKD